MSGAIPPVVLRGARRPHVRDASLAEGVTAEEVGWQPLCHTLPLQLVTHSPGAEGNLLAALRPVTEELVRSVGPTLCDEGNYVI